MAVSDTDSAVLPMTMTIIFVPSLFVHKFHYLEFNCNDFVWRRNIANSNAALLTFWCVFCLPLFWRPRCISSDNATFEFSFASGVKRGYNHTHSRPTAVCRVVMNSVKKDAQVVTVVVVPWNPKPERRTRLVRFMLPCLHPHKIYWWYCTILYEPYRPSLPTYLGDVCIDLNRFRFYRHIYVWKLLITVSSAASKKFLRKVFIRAFVFHFLSLIM